MRLRSGDRRRRRAARAGARPVPAPRDARAGDRASRAGSLCGGDDLPGAGSRGRRAAGRHPPEPRGERGAARDRMARRARRRGGDRLARAREHAADPPALRRGVRGRGRRSGRLRAQALRDPPARGEADRAGARGSALLLRHELLEPHARLHGDADFAADPGLLPRRLRSRLRVGALSRALALQHQHARLLESRASVPLSRPQRRDQHDRGKPELDARPRGHDVVRRCSARTSPSSIRSCAPDLPTPHASTTRWSSSCWRAESFPRPFS